MMIGQQLIISLSVLYYIMQTLYCYRCADIDTVQTGQLNAYLMHYIIHAQLCCTSFSHNNIDTTANRLRWYGHVLRKQDIDWVKKCIQYKVEGSKPRDITKRTWREVVQKDCQAHNLNREDAMDRGRWKKLIDWMMVQMVGGCFFWFRLTWVVPDKGP